MQSSTLMTSQITWSLLAGGKVHNRCSIWWFRVYLCLEEGCQVRTWPTVHIIIIGVVLVVHSIPLSGNNLNCRRNYVCQSVVLLYSDQQIPDPARTLSLPACCCCTNHYRLLLLIQSCMACQGQGHWLVVSTTVRSRSSPRRRHSFVEWRIAGVDDRETETDRNALGTCWSAICHELRKLT